MTFLRDVLLFAVAIVLVVLVPVGAGYLFKWLIEVGGPLLGCSVLLLAASVTFAALRSALS